MSETEEMRTALARLDAALSRIAAEVAKPRVIASPSQSRLGEQPASGEETAEAIDRHAIAARLDELIGGLRSALGADRPV